MEQSQEQRFQKMPSVCKHRNKFMNQALSSESLKPGGEDVASPKTLPKVLSINQEYYKQSVSLQSPPISKFWIPSIMHFIFKNWERDVGRGGRWKERERENVGLRGLAPLHTPPNSQFASTSWVQSMIQIVHLVESTNNYQFSIDQCDWT